jgi:hypothetical protein
MQRQKAPKSFAFTSPYLGCWLEHYYRQGGMDVFAQKVKNERQFRKLLAEAPHQPELMIQGNFIVERHAIRSICRQIGTDIVYSEDGFFPHYETLHVDPLGFSWESSLCRMIFRSLADHQRKIAREKREKWLNFPKQDFPQGIRPPYVLWPLQLIADQVNRWDLNVSDWSGLIIHFRQCLPKEYQLVIKPHPRGDKADYPKLPLEEMPNTYVLNGRCDLKSLIMGAVAIAGANSTVLMEARLMFHKPVYAYAHSWFTNHTDLFVPVSRRFGPRPLNHFDYVADGRTMRSEYLDDYTDWFLYQLLVRQLDRESASKWDVLRQWVLQRSEKAFVTHGEDVFR